jgi:hypothetical protein
MKKWILLKNSGDKDADFAGLKNKNCKILKIY